jgi:hypothetical protein
MIFPLKTLHSPTFFPKKKHCRRRIGGLPEHLKQLEEYALASHLIEDLVRAVSKVIPMVMNRK